MKKFFYIPLCVILFILGIESIKYSHSIYPYGSLLEVSGELVREDITGYSKYNATIIDIEDIDQYFVEDAYGEFVPIELPNKYFYFLWKVFLITGMALLSYYLWKKERKKNE
ncbi:MAG: hypothetical protein PHU61_01035 [Candidatus Absconditabacteria bacterium]|nr:hypothetical protein [Candidatus Absconditabacteria bacterium]MDD3868117.1 hypothetical protein [Candidatus Absconditabacteria bacterium]MDD4714365.1 hypothetical protein [Candidatus Absconditabacteria bacterium]